MLLYLLRHANADTEADTDDARPLSEKGLEQAEVAARFCQQHALVPERILTSPLPRAVQTAEPVAKALRLKLEKVDWLASGMSAQTAVKKLEELGKVRSVMIVGHEPDFSELAAHLLGLPTPQGIHFRKSALVALEVLILRAGAARLEFSIPSTLM